MFNGSTSQRNPPPTNMKEVYAEDGTMSYHDSETYTLAREIDMCTHFSVNPADEVDAGLVSLVAD